ncbi:SLAM family member 5-like [Garra rufa]|uniref:SLAM family member 5-like n=1 Tax=Garra rufa TaxID=137080 RepID=UPI003CCE59F2
MFHMFVFCLCWCCQIGLSGSETNIIQMMSVMEGDFVILHTNVTELQEEEDMQWKFGAINSLIAEITKAAEIFSTSDDVPDGRFRDRLKLDNQTGSLTITNITTQHAGLYQLQITGQTMSTKTFNVSVYARLPIPVIRRNCSSSSSSSQQNCSLVCSVVNVGHVTLSWYKGNSVLSSISVSDLSISLSLPLEVEYQDKNTYSCVINNPISNQTQHLDISKLCHTCADFISHKMPISASAAGSLLIVAVIWIFLIYKKQRKTIQEDETVDEEITYAEPTFHKQNALNKAESCSSNQLICLFPSSAVTLHNVLHHHRHIVHWCVQW